MATTNDVQKEEPPMTTLERQVKTLTAAVERLTKQNRDLKEQLHQKNAAPDNQGTNHKEPEMKEGIKRDHRLVTPQADQSDKT